ncbi:MAG: PAS domain S-box protein [Promethearchaeota archaeon]
MDLLQNKFLWIIDNIKEGYYEVDLKGNYIYCNKALCELTGFSREELLKLNYKQLTDKKNQKIAFEGYNTVYKTGIPKIDLEYQFFNKSKEIVTGETSVYLKYDSEGNKIGFYGIFRDITKRKKEEERFKDEFEQLVNLKTKELRESEEKYSNLFHHSNDGILLHDIEGNIIEVNQRALEQFGYTRSEILKLKIVDLHPANALEASKKAFEEIQKKGVIEFEITFKKKNGEIFIAEVSSSMFYMGGKKVIKGNVRDITERILTEKKLKESEERYRNLIESVPFSILLINQQGKVSYCNPEVEKTFGYTQEELIGQKFQDLSGLYSEYIPTMVNRFQKVLKGEILPPKEIKLKKKDGNLAWISYQSTLVKVGDETSLQIVINDVTEKRKADVLINEEIVKLKELDQIRKDLISRVSHELKTPLVSVCGASELLLDLYLDQLKDEPKELIEMIEKGGKRLKYLVDNLVDITRIEYGKFKLKKEKTDINQLIKDCIKEMKYLIGQRELKLELNLLDELFLEIDKIRIEQVILNLLSNAIKNTPPKGMISIYSSRKDGKVEIIIKDTGIGLTKEEMDRLFIRFGKIERYGEGLEYIDIQGTGLGLYISKEIIDLHEGQIWVESEGRNKGCSFIFKLPINQL